MWCIACEGIVALGQFLIPLTYETSKYPIMLWKIEANSFRDWELSFQHFIYLKQHSQVCDMLAVLMENLEKDFIYHASPCTHLTFEQAQIAILLCLGCRCHQPHPSSASHLPPTSFSPRVLKTCPLSIFRNAPQCNCMSLSPFLPPLFTPRYSSSVSDVTKHWPKAKQGGKDPPCPIVPGSLLSEAKKGSQSRNQSRDNGRMPIIGSLHMVCSACCFF